MSNELSFAELREANMRRSTLWEAGNKPFTLEFSIIELCGETGELANAVKKLLRHRGGVAGGVADMKPVIDELADVVICCDLLGRTLGIDLAAAVTAKFNATSAKHGFTVMLPLEVAIPCKREAENLYHSLIGASYCSGREDDLNIEKIRRALVAKSAAPELLPLPSGGAGA